MANVFAVFLGAGLGGVLRYLVSLLVRREYHGHFPLGTFLINIAGCFAIGYLATLFNQAFPVRESWRHFVLVGVLGGFTTFSSFGRETFELMGEGKLVTAGWYVMLSNIIGIALVWAGHHFANQLHPASIQG